MDDWWLVRAYCKQSGLILSLAVSTLDMRQNALSKLLMYLMASTFYVAVLESKLSFGFGF